MHAVVNLLHLKDPLDEAVLARAQAELSERARAVDGFRALYVMQPSDDELILVVVCDSADAAERLATEVGSPWIIEHVAPHLAGPPERRTGPVVVMIER